MKSLKAMRPRTIVLLLTFAALAVGNYALTYQDWKVLLILCGFVWVFLAIHGHEEAKSEAHRKGHDEGYALALKEAEAAEERAAARVRARNRGER